MVETLVHGFFTGVGIFCNAIIICIGIAAEFIRAFANAI